MSEVFRWLLLAKSDYDSKHNEMLDAEIEV